MLPAPWILPAELSHAQAEPERSRLSQLQKVKRIKRLKKIITDFGEFAIYACFKHNGAS
jgi:hypothetical protein